MVEYNGDVITMRIMASVGPEGWNERTQILASARSAKTPGGNGLPIEHTLAGAPSPWPAVRKGLGISEMRC